MKKGTRVYWHGVFPEMARVGTVQAPGSGTLRTPVLWDGNTKPELVANGALMKVGTCRCARCGGDFTPVYERWRHGGWYVTNVRYASGAVGCVSRNYADKKWRIVCGDHGVTYPSRDAAARAERAITLTGK